MILSEKQSLFALNAAKLILWISEQPGYRVTLNEAYRTKEQAAIYASQGKGISASLHCIRLAIDLNLYKDGEYLSRSEEYKIMGDYWKSLHPDNKWGGDFKSHDGCHFSMGHEGRA